MTGHSGHDGPDGRGVRFLDWTWDPDPTDTEFVVDIACLLRECDGTVRVAQDRHRFGLFATATWVTLLAQTGFQPAVERCEYAGAERALCFIGVRKD